MFSFSSTGQIAANMPNSDNSAISKEAVQQNESGSLADEVNSKLNHSGEWGSKVNIEDGKVRFAQDKPYATDEESLSTIRKAFEAAYNGNYPMVSQLCTTIQVDLLSYTIERGAMLADEGIFDLQTASDLLSQNFDSIHAGGKEGEISLSPEQRDVLKLYCHVLQQKIDSDEISPEEAKAAVDVIDKLLNSDEGQSVKISSKEAYSLNTMITGTIYPDVFHAQNDSAAVAQVTKSASDRLGDIYRKA